MSNLTGLKVCFLAGTLGQGGAERQLYYMIRTLVEARAKPRVLCLTTGEFWEPRLRELGVSVDWVGQSPSRLKRVRRMVAALEADRPHVLQSQHFYTNLYVVAAARLLGLAEVGALRSDGTSEAGQSFRLLRRLSLRVPRMVAANSRAGIDNAAALGMPRARMRLLPNVVDTSRFTVRTPIPSESVRLLAIGRLVQAKRFDRFIRVLRDTRARSRTPVEGVIIGDGPQRGELEQQARALGLSPDALRFEGAAPDVMHAYHAADVLVVTSDWEGTPNVVLEAMASGLPVVATDVGGIRDLVRNGETGRLVARDDEADLADAVVSLVADRPLRERYGKRAREFVEERHALARLPANLGSLYDAVLGRAELRTTARLATEEAAG